MIDSDASFHVTIDPDYLTFYVNSDYGHVRMKNERALKIVGIEDICLETSVGCKLSLKDIRHLLDICLDLISIGKLDDDGYTNQFGEGKWKFTKGSLMLTKGGK